MVRSVVKVAIRSRPTSNIAKDILDINPEQQTVEVTLKKRREEDYVSNQPEHWAFKFDHILHNASQEAVYDVCGKDIGQSLVDGYNGTVIAYGQTGAGKTFTMLGPNTESYKYRGVIPRVLADVFKEISDRPQTKFVVRCSYLEIYNELLYDLLSDEGGKNLHIVEDDSGNIVVLGLSKREISSEEEGLKLLFEGDTRRMVAEHQFNKNSSRSHCIFTLYVEASSRVESNARVTMSKLNLVDLAGSERVKKSKSEGKVLKEAMFINKSLTFLEQVVIALAAKKKREHIPYRQSRLTNVLKDTLGANAKVFLIANIFVEAQHIEETVSTLKFASRMMLVEQEATVMVAEDDSMKVKKLERLAAELKSELAMHDAIVNRSHIVYDPYTEEQRYELRKQVMAYTRGEVDDLEVASVRHVREIFIQFREIVEGLRTELEQARRGAPGPHLGAPEAGTGKPLKGAVPMQAVASVEKEEDGDVVGDLEGTGFGVGVAPPGARPKTIALSGTRKAGRVASPSVQGRKSQAALAGPVPSSPSRTPQPGVESGRVSPGIEGVEDVALAPADSAAPLVFKTREEAFEEFKTDPEAPGYEFACQLQEHKGVLKEKKEILRSLGFRTNERKRVIDDLKGLLERKKQERSLSQPPTEDEIIDEEEYEALKQLKEAKRGYREAHSDLTNAKTECDGVQRVIDELRHKLLSEFETWYSLTYRMLPQPAPSVAEASLPPSVSHPGDVLDYGEQFDQLELQRIVTEDPDSAAFYNARKSLKSRGSPVHSRMVREHKAALKSSFRS